MNDELICEAVNLIIENKGGISAVSKNESQVLALPIAGIMTNADGQKVASQYSKICLLYTSPSPRDATLSRMPSSA